MTFANTAPHSRIFTTNPFARRALAVELRRNARSTGAVGSRLPCTDLGPVRAQVRHAEPATAAPRPADG